MSYAVVIVNWNGAADTIACLDSIYAGSNGALVIVVDNISDQFAGAQNRMLINTGGRFVQRPSPFDEFQLWLSTS